MQYLVLALIKFIDSMVITAKSIALYQGKAIISAFLTILSQILFYFVVSKVITDGTTSSIIIVAISSGVGSYVASFFNKKFKKDRLWVNIITCSNMNAIKELSNFLYKEKIRCVVYDSYTRSGEKTYALQAFAKTKEESILIDKYLQNSGIKCLREIID